jgi:hypothetical protein
VVLLRSCSVKDHVTKGFRFRLIFAVATTLLASCGGVPASISPGGLARLELSSGRVRIVAEFMGQFTGSYPNGPLVMDATGNMYGTAATGGASGCLGFGCGTAFKLTRSSAGYTATTIHEFGSDQDGDPEGGLIVDAGGNLYGTTYFGPTNNYGPTGTVFELAPTASGYAETILYTFRNGKDGDRPVGSLARDKSGALYGVTAYGGLNGFSGCGGCGIVYRLVPTGSAYTESVLYRFKGGTNDGSTPASSLVLDARGDLFGVTELGGSTGCSDNGCGIAYELVRAGSVYTEKILHAFTGKTDGAFPSGALTVDASGNLYGATLDGGRGCRSLGCGTIFELQPSHPNYAERVIYAFKGGSRHVDGIAPNGNLFTGTNGSIVGTTRYDSSHECRHSSRGACGTIFMLARDGTEYTERILYRFSQIAFGTVPMPGFVRGADGAFYGTTAGGGDPQCTDGLPGCGTVYAAALP